MTLSSPSLGHDPAWPKGRVDLEDFPLEAQALLRNFSKQNVRSLAIQAGCDLSYADESTYSKDPAQAAKDALELLGRKAVAEIDGGTQEAIYSLRIAVLVLGQEDDLGGRDCQALAWLLNRAEDILDQEQRFNREAGRRLWVGTGGRPL